jgi:hypothetical protein
LRHQDIEVHERLALGERLASQRARPGLRAMEIRMVLDEYIRDNTAKDAHVEKTPFQYFLKAYRQLARSKRAS